MKLAVAKFGGSAIGPDGISIPIILQRIDSMRQDAKVIAVFSAPLTVQNGRPRSLTDIILEEGAKAEKGQLPSIDTAESVYGRILDLAGPSHEQECRAAIDRHLEMAQKALLSAYDAREFANETRSKALAYSGEVLMSHVMSYIIQGRGIRAEAVSLEHWPIITDKNIEFTNFLYSESSRRLHRMEDMVLDNDVVTIGGFIGKTADGIITTYERGGSDRTAADLGILFSKEHDAALDFEKDSMVVSADPKIVSEDLRHVSQMSYNEARLAGMFGMKILDPIAIKEILENGVDISISITNMKDPKETTVIKRETADSDSHPLKIVTGKRNCAILRMEEASAQKLQKSLGRDKRYSEYVVLSPFIRDGIEFSRILFLDDNYVRRNERYILGFDSLATITYNRGVITLIGDEMWRVQQVVSRVSAKMGDIGLNILNMDAQEETSRIILVIEDAGENVADAIRSIHAERNTIRFI